ncbi:unnamed protein product [Oreochromis niloticus]|nr:unnamed protein product [Mustela putorius furo]
MAKAHSYPLLVEFEETNTPILKMKLLQYFFTVGGNCDIEYEKGSKTAVVHFRRQEDQRNVLAKESHQISLEKGVLKLTVRLPTEEKSSQEFPLDKDNMKSVEKIKGKDSIKNEEARVHRFSVLEVFRRSFYGKPSLKLPAAISEPIDSAVLRYLAQKKSATESICKEMEKHFCIINLGQTTVTLSPVSSLLEQKDAKAIIKEWTDTVKSEFAQSVSKFKSVKLYPDSDAWEESEKKIREMLLNENVIVVPDKDRGALSVAGPVSDVNRLEKSLSEIINKIHREKSSKTEEIKVSPSVFRLLCEHGLMHKLLLLDLSHAQDHLGQLLTSQYIHVEDSNVLKKPEWQQLVSHLEQANSKPCRTRINTTAQQVVVSGYKDSVIKVQHQLGDFLTQNAHIEETVVVKANAVVEYLKDFNTSWMEKVKDKVRVSYRNEAICLSGSRVNVTHCKTVVEGAVSAVVFDSLSVYKSGVKKLFQENEAMYVSSIKNITGCLVQLVDKQVPTPLYQLRTPDGVEIAVCKADMCSYPVDAVVSPFNQDLKHSTGIAAALVKAAGPQLQDEFQRTIQLLGKLNAGDFVLSDAGGQLCCQKVIHAVGPKYEKDKPQKGLDQLTKVVKGSLELAEAYRCVSVALPSIGRGLGFPFNQCELTIVKAVKEYCDEKCDDILQKIHFVNNDDIAVQDMVAAVRQEFENHGVTHSQQGPHPNAHKPPVLQPTGSDLYLYHVQTNEGLDIILKKGNIEFSKIERIQNPVLWNHLQIKKRDLELRNGQQDNERRLFHGTSEDTVAAINDRGFNRSYAGKNAALYGNGTYFAVNASYSANDTYSKPNQNGEKFMYVCRVLTGDFTLGQQDMIVPPAKGPASTDLYDSVVDNLTNPTMFVVFHDAQAYPEYLITFK